MQLFPIRLVNQQWQDKGQGKLTLRAKYMVRIKDPKYAEVNGNLVPEVRCLKYAHGPIIAAKDMMKSIEPSVHLWGGYRTR